MAPPIAGRIKQQMTMNRILMRLVMKMDERRTMMPMTPVGICMRMVVKELEPGQECDEERLIMSGGRTHLKPNPLVMRPPNVPIPPEGQATALRVS
jgi:hypothetical protein